MSDPANVFLELVDSTFTVTLKRDDKEYNIKVRRLPFSTMTSILSALVISAQEEIMRARKKVIEEVSSLGLSNVDLEGMMDIIMPVITASIIETPAIAERVLLDVCVGLTEDTIKALTMEDVLVILHAVLERMDKALVAEKVRAVFFLLQQLAMETIQLQTNKEKQKLVLRKPQKATNSK